MKEHWIKEVRLFLDVEGVQHLHDRALNTEDEDELKIILQRAKKLISADLSLADQLLNKKF